MNMNGLYANFFRDISVDYEKKGDITLACHLMAIAKSFRPNGPFIKSSYERLEKKNNKWEKNKMDDFSVAKIVYDSVDEKRKYIVSCYLLDHLDKSNGDTAFILDWITCSNVSQEAILSALYRKDLDNYIGFISQKKEGGRPDHYNHYFGSVIMSFVDIYDKGIIDHDKIYFMMGNGPFDQESLIMANKMNIKLVLLDLHQFMKEDDIRKFKRHKITTNKIEVIQLIGFDAYWEPSSTLRIDGVFERLKYNIGKCFNLNFHSNANKSKKPKILIVSRRESSKYYTKYGRISGSSRRSIKNIDELYYKVKKKYAETELCFFEDINLLKKANMLNSTDIIILQHGAALFNMVFMREDSLCIEILPNDFLFDSSMPHINKAGVVMAYKNKMRHIQIFQKTHFSPVHIKQLLRIVDSYIGNPEPDKSTDFIEVNF